MSYSQLPFQSLKNLGEFLVAARGSSIYILDSTGSTTIASWDCPPDVPELARSSSTHEEASAPAGSPDVLGHDSRVAKKRKLAASGHGELDNGPDPAKGKKRNNRSDAVNSGLDAPAVVVLEVAPHSKHVIVVTGEDKSIRVFKMDLISGKYGLNLLSTRSMPKRPCALAITADESTIISADKFGDVYSLPLLFTERTNGQNPAVQVHEPSISKPFIPAANELTIHSQRNRKALENQKRQSNRKPEKPDATFDHTLLLGHVSMLIDVKLATLEGREYIITADRDEHIRVSRSIPQTHVIENFCLGHSDFVSRICIPKNRPDILISGGGDDELFMWHWVSGHNLSKTDLRAHMVGRSDRLVTGGTPTSADSPGMAVVDEKPRATQKLAVSGIYHFHEPTEVLDFILVTCEVFPAILVFVLTPNNTLQFVETVTLPGNAIAIATDVTWGTKQMTLPDQLRGIVVAIDNAHKPGSSRELRTTEETTTLHRFTFHGTSLISQSKSSNQVKGDTSPEEPANATVLTASTCTSALDRLSSLLYTLDGLRKRGEGELQDD